MGALAPGGKLMSDVPTPDTPDQPEPDDEDQPADDEQDDAKQT